MSTTAWLGNGDHVPGRSVEDLPFIADTSHIRVRKYWRYIFIVVFVLSKVFLATSIYFFLEYKHQQELKQTTPLQVIQK